MPMRIPISAGDSKTLRVETYHLACGGCNTQVLNDARAIRRILIETASTAGLTPLFSKIHRFPLRGLTGFVVLGESHISIHTWPEHAFAVIDIQTCNRKAKLNKAIAYIKRKLEAGQLSVGRHSLKPTWR